MMLLICILLIRTKCLVCAAAGCVLPPEPSTVLTILGGVSTNTGQSTTPSGAAFVCLQNVSAGSFTVPASILSQLPASPSIGAGGFNFVVRGTFSVTASGKGVRWDAPANLDILTGINSWSWIFTPQYQ